MDDHPIKTIEVNSLTNTQTKDEWVEKHARQLELVFKQWQQPIGVDGKAYRKHLEKELADYWEDPILKTLIETI